MPDSESSLLKDAHRDSSRLPSLAGLVSDLRFAFRVLRHDRAFSFAAISMLALGLALNVTAFTVMDAMLFRGFPLVKDNDRLVYMQERSESVGCCISYMDFEDWRLQAQAFEGLAFVGERPATFRGDGERSIRLLPFTVSANTFELLGVQPILGRSFAATDEGPGAAPVAILSYEFWQSWFGGRDDIVGFTAYFDDVPATIIGVMPEGFSFPTAREIWRPVIHTPELHQRGVAGAFQDPGGYLAFGRLRDGVDLEEARVELETINRRLESAYPETNQGVVPRVRTHSEFFVGPEASTIYGSLWAGAWFILLIACANLANLTLAKTIGRSREFSTKSALGVGSGRMIRQILMEGLTIAGVAGAIAYLIAKWGLRTWALATESPYQILNYAMDSRTVGYLAVIAVASAMLFSTVPIRKVLRLSAGDALSGGIRGVTRDRRGSRLAAVAVAGQMALAMVLLSGAGVLVISLLNIVTAETGVSDPDNVLVGSMRLPPDRYPSPEARLAYFDRLEEQLGSVPGIEYASVASSLPVDSGSFLTFEIDGRPITPDGGELTAQFLSVGPDYFRVVEASVVRGRDFDTGDDGAALPVAIVNERFVADWWPGEEPLGKILRARDGEWRTVVGVVPNIMQGDGLRQQFRPLIYVPFRQEPVSARPQFFLVRTGVPPDQVAQAVRAEVEELDIGVTLEGLATLRANFAFRADRMARAHSELGKHAAVAPIFAVIALLLAAIGLYAGLFRVFSG